MKKFIAEISITTSGWIEVEANSRAEALKSLECRTLEIVELNDPTFETEVWNLEDPEDETT